MEDERGGRGGQRGEGLCRGKPERVLAGREGLRTSVRRVATKNRSIDILQGTD